MEIIIIVCAIIIFLLFILYFHTRHAHVHMHVSKIYVDSHIIDITAAELKITNWDKSISQLGHLEELILSLQHGVQFPQIWQNGAFKEAVNSLILHPQLKNFTRNDSYANSQSLTYRPELKYGGCNFEVSENCAFAHIFGDPEAVVKECTTIHDKEEILRVAQKWEKQGLQTIAVGTMDSERSGANILMHGIRGKMTFLGLIGIDK